MGKDDHRHLRCDVCDYGPGDIYAIDRHMADNHPYEWRKRRAFVDGPTGLPLLYAHTVEHDLYYLWLYLGITDVLEFAREVSTPKRQRDDTLTMTEFLAWGLKRAMETGR